MMHLSIDKKIKIYFYFFLFLLFSTLFNLNLEIYFKNMFRITNIENKDDNIKINDINHFINNNIFNIDKKSLEHKLENNPILKFYEIKKIYPDTLKIDLVKSNPIAKILQNESYFYLGDNGKIFNSTDINHSITEVEGQINLKYLNKVINIINHSPFKLNKIKSIKIYPSKRFDLKFNNNNIIKFPYNADQKFMEDAFLFYKNNSVYDSIIDLRLKNKIIISDE